MKICNTARSVLVNSIPKSGTYFVGKILESAGLADTGLHFREDRVWNWNEADNLDQVIKNPNEFMHIEDFVNFMNRGIPKEGFFYGHLNYNERIRNFLSASDQMNHIFLYRNLKDCLVSSMRFGQARDVANGVSINNSLSKQDLFCDYMKKDGERFIKSAKKQVGWLGQKNVKAFSFEKIIDGSLVSDLLNSAGFEVDTDLSYKLYKKSLGERTRTFSGRTSDWREYWSDEANEIYEYVGGGDLNKLLGYDI